MLLSVAVSVAVSAAVSSSLSFLSTRAYRAYWTDRYCGCCRRDGTYRANRTDRYSGR